MERIVQSLFVVFFIVAVIFTMYGSITDTHRTAEACYANQPAQFVKIKAPITNREAVRQCYR